MKINDVMAEMSSNQQSVFVGLGCLVVFVGAVFLVRYIRSKQPKKPGEE